MTRNVKMGVAVGAVLLVALGGGAAALARGGGADESAFDREGVLEEAASRLDVEPAELRNSLREAFEQELDEAVAEGRLTRAQADRIKARIRAGGGPPMFDGEGPPRFDGDGFPGPPRGAWLGVLEAAASYLDTTVAELREDVRSGKTLAEIAEEEGKSVEGLQHALVDAAREKLQDRVEAGDLTQARADEILSRLSDRVDDIVAGRLPDGDGPPMFDGDGPPGHPLGDWLGLFEAAASYLDMTVGELREDVRSGKTLAEIAADEGKSVEGLRDALVDAAREKLQRRVDAGALPQARADAILSRLSDRIDDIVEGRLPGRHPADAWP
jgi:hypothetical protein